jgi:hypothetical protein
MKSPLGCALGGGLPRCLKDLEGAMAIPNARAVETMQVTSARGVFRRYLHLSAIVERNQDKNPEIAIEDKKTQIATSNDLGPYWVSIASP